MLNLPPSVRVFFCTQPVDMRYSFDRLAMLAEQVLQENPYTGHLFVYVNRRADRVKLLYWDRTGLAIWYKRLEKGTFRFASDAEQGARVEMDATELTLILEGIDLRVARRQARYHRTCSIEAKGNGM